MPITYFSVLSINAVLSAKIQNDWINETDVMDERYFERFEFKMRASDAYPILYCPQG